MTLILTVFAAITVTYIWYKDCENKKKLGILCLMYWGASLMWLVDVFFEGSAFFNPAPADLLNDLFLGLVVAALGLVIWLVRLLIADPEGNVKAKLNRMKSEKLKEGQAPKQRQ